MNINRHNYETFFLLYVDKELSAAEKKAVELFVTDNPDLQIELSMLQETVLNADEIVLQKKDWLFREEDITPLQENLLLYADDELSTSERKAVDGLLFTDESVAAEWNILKRTKFAPETTIVFNDKQSLYRREEGRVVALKWWRAAAAAVLLGFGLWSGLLVYKNITGPATRIKSHVHETDTSPKQTETVLPAASNMEIVPVAEDLVIDKLQPTENKQNNNTSTPAVVKSTVESSKKQDAITSKENIAIQKQSPIKLTNDLPKPHFENINNKGSNENISMNVSPENNNSKVSGNNEAVVKSNPNDKIRNSVVPDVNKVTVSEPNNSTAIRVVNKTPDENNNNRYLDVDDDNEKRTALGGFLRKARRMIERTTNVKAGEGLKIAGFEIALK